jgi:hypothetical protein
MIETKDLQAEEQGRGVEDTAGAQGQRQPVAGGCRVIVIKNGEFVGEQRREAASA